MDKKSTTLAKIEKDITLNGPGKFKRVGTHLAPVDSRPNSRSNSGGGRNRSNSDTKRPSAYTTIGDRSVNFNPETGKGSSASRRTDEEGHVRGRRGDARTSAREPSRHDREKSYGSRSHRSRGSNDDRRS